MLGKCFVLDINWDKYPILDIEAIIRGNMASEIVAKTVIHIGLTQEVKAPAEPRRLLV